MAESPTPRIAVHTSPHPAPPRTTHQASIPRPTLPEPFASRRTTAWQDGRTGLYLASLNRNFEMVRLLLDNKADANLAKKVQPPPHAFGCD